MLSICKINNNGILEAVSSKSWLLLLVMRTLVRVFSQKFRIMGIQQSVVM